MTFLTPDNLSSVNTENFVFLSKVKYVEEKREILLDFSNLEGKICKKFPFFPQLSIPVISQEVLDSVVSIFGKKSFILEKSDNAITFKASNFSELKKLADFLHSSIRVDFVLIEPERQFLLLKNWSYFDYFNQNSDGELEFVENFSIPKLSLEFFAESLEVTLADLIELDRRNAKALVESTFLSNILCLPLAQLPENRFDWIEFFFENNFFREKAFFKKSNGHFCESNVFPPGGIFSNIAELDFFPVWNKIFSKNFYNLGFESINCPCCEPVDFVGKNLMPNSLLKVKFLEDGFYFESFSKNFSEKFHSENPFKENRLRRKSEFFLKTFPIGPFFKNQTATIMLSDALALEKSQSVQILGFFDKKWFCSRKESFISTAFSELNNCFDELEKRLLEREQLVFSRGFVLLQENSLDRFYLQSRKDFVLSFCEEILRHLADSNSRFYSGVLAESLSSVQELVFSKFKVFGEKNSSKSIHLFHNRAFVESETPLVLVKGFSLNERMPMPEIRAVHKKIVF